MIATIAYGLCTAALAVSHISGQPASATTCPYMVAEVAWPSFNASVRPGDRPVHIEWVVDWSHSYPALGSALEAATGVCRALRPGDRLTVRRITDRSYSSSAVLVDVRLPEVTGGRFRSPARAARERSAADSVEAAHRQACEALAQSAHLPRTSRTDITGSLAAAAASFRQDDDGTQRVLVISTDGEETERAGNVQLTLGGVAVRFVAVESRLGPLERLERRLEAWSEVLRAAGVTDVQVLPPGARLDLDALRTAARPPAQSAGAAGGR